MLRLSKLTDYAVVVLVRLSRDMGVQTSPGIAATIVIDSSDAALLEPIRALGMRVLVDDTVMEGAQGERRLAASLLRALVERPRRAL